MRPTAVVAGPAGAVCPRWRVARVTPGGSWIHGSGPLHRRTADRGHSFGCQQDKPSASLVTTNRTSMCIDLQMYAVDCFLLGIKLHHYLIFIFNYLIAWCSQLIDHSTAQKRHFWRYSLIFYWTWMIRKSLSLSCLTSAQHSTQLTTVSYWKP